jgi:thiamine-phosphate pyrophosphorylase
MATFALAGYYAILNLKGQETDVVPRAQELLQAEPCCLQLRAKDLGAQALAEVARAVAGACRAMKVPFCVNDRVDVALAAGADAVHVGQDDLPLDQVRRITGGRLAIGVSTHTLAQAQAAARGGADYIGFGPLFATRSKAQADPPVGLEGLRQVLAAVTVPVVAIGGIALEQVPAVAATGAHAVAVIAAVMGAEDRAAAARRVVVHFARGRMGRLSSGAAAARGDV